jgi:VIT1/CCC1 family predicted Fe2+/Mn2+ transporter
MPLLMVVVSPAGALVPIVAAASLAFLALLGAIGGRAGGANVLRATARVTFWGALARALTAGIGNFSAPLSEDWDHGRVIQEMSVDLNQ